MKVAFKGILFKEIEENSTLYNVYQVGVNKLFVIGLFTNPSCAKTVEVKTKKTNPKVRTFFILDLL